MSPEPDRVEELRLIDRVDALNEEVRILALNIAIHLARTRGRSGRLTALEADFVRLVNGTVKVVQQLARVISAARNVERRGDESAVGHSAVTGIEARLRSIMEQCAGILATLSGTGKLTT